MKDICGNDTEFIRFDNDPKATYYPEYSEWKCYCFGMCGDGIVLTPLKGKEPNWFWRKMQYLCFGNRWVKE